MRTSREAKGTAPEVSDDNADAPVRGSEDAIWTSLRSDSGRKLLVDALVAALIRQPANQEALVRWIDLSGDADAGRKRNQSAQSDAPSTKVKAIAAKRGKLNGKLEQAQFAERKAAQAHAIATSARVEVENTLADLDANEATVLADAFLKAIEQRLLPAAALGPAFSMMRILSGYYQTDTAWEATLPQDQVELVRLRREERPKRSAEMMVILDALAGDPYFELVMFRDLYNLLAKQSQAAKERGTLRTGSAYRSQLNPAAKRNDMADVVSGIPIPTGASN